MTRSLAFLAGDRAALGWRVRSLFSRMTAHSALACQFFHLPSLPSLLISLFTRESRTAAREKHPEISGCSPVEFSLKCRAPGPPVDGTPPAARVRLVTWNAFRAVASPRSRDSEKRHLPVGRARKETRALARDGTRTSLMRRLSIGMTRFSVGRCARKCPVPGALFLCPSAQFYASVKTRE